MTNKTEAFSFNGRDFEIRAAVFDGVWKVVVFELDRQISPTYTVSCETVLDAANQEYSSDLVDRLIELAKSDILEEMYILPH